MSFKNSDGIVLNVPNPNLISSLTFLYLYIVIPRPIVLRKRKMPKEQRKSDFESKDKVILIPYEILRIISTI